MSLYSFKLPDVGEGIAEAEITAWHVAVGETIVEDQPLVDVMTDKATVELPSPVAGKIVALHGALGDTRAVGSELVVLEVAEEGEDTDGATPEDPSDEVLAAAEPAPAPPDQATPGATASEPEARPSASPAVRNRARELGLDLRSLTGSGPGGRITHQDLDALLLSGRGVAPASPSLGHDTIEEVKIVGLRRRIAERMQESTQRIPHFSYIEEVDVSALEDLREHLNTARSPERPKLTPLPFLIRALVKALAPHPQINAHFDDDAGILRQHRAVHVGIATQTDAGLLVPVIRHAEALDLWASAAELARVAAAARENRAGRDELSGSTITITSLGALGGLATTPVINRPEVAIVGVNRIVERPIVRQGIVTVRRMMNLSSSFDHRVVDGFHAATFIQRVKALLEQPATLFVD